MRLQEQISLTVYIFRKCWMETGKRICAVDVEAFICTTQINILAICHIVTFI